jgi:hypothetical protein
MIKHSEAFAAAVVADTRRAYLHAEMLLIAPMLSYGMPEGDFAAMYSRPEQVSDHKFDGTDRYYTLEQNRTVLDGSARIMPDDAAEMTGQIGAVSSTLSGADGEFAEPWTVTLPIGGVSVLQACSVWFADGAANGVPADFVVEITDADGETKHAETFRDHRSDKASFTGFTVYEPAAIRLTVTKWSRPYTRARVVEMLPGLREQWDHHIFQAFTIDQQADFSNLVLPYGSCTILIDNSDKRFEPETKNSLFESIEAGQSINTSIGIELPDGSVEYIPTGRYYQANGGWTTGNNSLTMQWDLIDIVGLAVDRRFVMPETVPNTLKGWIAAAMASVSEELKEQYIIAEGYENVTVETIHPENIKEHTVGDIIRYACMVAGCYCHADNETGKLIVEPVGDAGADITLGNITAYPNIKANSSLGSLVFSLTDGNDTQVEIAGNDAASGSSTTITNPFIFTEAQARQAAAHILKYYGGNMYEITGRGNPASEVGDVDTIQLSRGTTVKGRRQAQALTFRRNVLSACTATYLKVAETAQAAEQGER